MASEAQGQKFLARLGKLGGSAGNGSLRDELGWTEKTYKRVRQELIEIGRIEVGRGRGGSVRLVTKSDRSTRGVQAPAARSSRRDGGRASSTLPAAMARMVHTPTKRTPVGGASTAGSRVENYKHTSSTRKNIPTAELEPVMRDEDKSPLRLAYERRNRDLDPQLVWHGKDQQDWSDLIVQAPPLYIQEKVHPKVLIDDLLRQSKVRAAQASPMGPDLFADFNGLPDKEAVTEFYQHDANWSNRMILGDSLSVMASLAEREGLRGQVQCIYVDPPYGIKFNSNFQWSTTSRDVKDGNKEHITREPEQVKAFRDTWRDGIHSYLTYLRDRLTVARELLTDSGSIFVQIGDENLHRVLVLSVRPGTS